MNLQQPKVLFFAQYLGQTWNTYDHQQNIIAEGKVFWLLSPQEIKQSVVLLRTADQLTDDEVIQIANMYGWNEDNKQFDDRVLQFRVDLPCIVKDGYTHRHMKFIFDYLLRIGILLDFTYLNEENKPVTLQPNEIISLGWAKIKEA